MVKCAYCLSNKKMTREHIIPDWYIQIAQNSREFYSEKVPGKYFQSNTGLVVKDVCSECNNNILGLLDENAKKLYEGYFGKPVLDKSPILLNADYDMLVRWLLKVSYNSARANKSDLNIFKNYRNAILGHEAITDNLLVSSIAFPALSDGSAPRSFRVGMFSIDSFDGYYWAFRHIVVDSFCFYLFIPKANKKERELHLGVLKDIIKNSPEFFGRVIDKNNIKIYVSSITHDEHLGSHKVQNPVTYNLLDEDHLNDFKKIKDDSSVVFLPIMREEIEDKNFDRVLNTLNSFVISREIALGFLGKVEVCIVGYEDDIRELYEISEVAEYLIDINTKWAYWMFIQFPQGCWLSVLLSCLSCCEESNERVFYLDLSVSRTIIEHWFSCLNELTDKFRIDNSINEEIGENALNIIKKYLK